MIRSVSGGSTLPVASAESTEEVTQLKESASTNSTEATNQTQDGARTDGAAQKAESSLSGQAQAAQLHSKVPMALTASTSAAAPPAAPSSSAPAAAPATGSTSAAGASAATQEPPLLIKDSVGPQVEKFQKDLNTWRAENGKPAITADGTYGEETEVAVRDFQKAMGMNPDGKAASTTHERLKMESDANFKKLDPDTKQQVRDQMNLYDKEKDSAAKENLKKIATDPNIANLPKESQLNALRAFGSVRSDVQTENIRSLAANPNIQKLDDSSKNKVFDLAGKNGNSPQYLTDLRGFAGSSNFEKMPPADREKALNLFSSSSPAGRKSLETLINRQVNGESALMSKASDGTTTLDNLDRLSKTPLNYKITDSAGGAQSKHWVMEDLMAELSKPDQNINQGDRGTCTVTSITNNLAKKSPGEYARLVTDLSTKGQAKMANGDTIVPPEDGFPQDGSGRSVGERLLQSSLMNYAKPWNEYQNWNPGPDGLRGTPDDGVIDPTNPQGVQRDTFKNGGGGLQAQDNIRVLEGLYNKKFERSTDNLLDRTKTQIDQGKGPVFTGVQWGSLDPNAPASQRGAHAIEVTKIENGRVYFRNPWGPGAVGPTDPPGELGLGRVPPARVEDGPNGVQSMSIEEYNKRSLDIIVQK